MRRLAKGISSDAKLDLSMIANHQTSVAEYRDAFYRLGSSLAERLPLGRLGKDILLVCTSEDADFLARGILDSIVKGHTTVPARVALACFWQARLKAFSATSDQEAMDVAPIVRRYEEPTSERIDSLIVVKSIISSSCVVRHALLDVIGRKHPKNILIAAPVILRGAQMRLSEEFPVTISRQFEFFYFAEDDEKDDVGNVLPGIGGSIYQRLGLIEPATFTPRLVRERRKTHTDMVVHPYRG